jgi:riboflavin kinase/FMN adenylyltransferase
MATFVHSLGQAIPRECHGGAITVGNFDGVHRGHQALVAEAVSQARASGGPAVCVTFDPHPTQIFRPESFQPLLTTPAYRAELLQGYGVDHVLILDTTPALLQLRAGEFFENILRDGLRSKAIIEGFNFGFGKNREGTLELLQELGRQTNIGVTLLSAIEVEGRPVSTSRVRGDVLAGAVEHVRELLGRPYRLWGKVGAGQRRGKSLGFPTANLNEVDNLVPGNGVYAVDVSWQDRTWRGAANVGPNPTFGEQARKVEVHLLDFEGDLYGERLSLDFIAKIRDTRAFAGVDELVQQIRDDVNAVRSLHGSPPPV